MVNNKIPSFLVDFSNYLLAIKNYSNTYVENLNITIQQFLNFMNVHKYHNKYSSIEKFTLNDIRFLANSDIYSFIYFLAESHYGIGSRILKMEHLRTFFDYLYRIKHNIFIEPFKHIKREKNIYLKLPNYLSLDESKKLLNLYDNSTKVNQIRDNAMLHLFLNCGLRVSEVINLKISDFNFKTDIFTILGKGNKERTGYLNDITKTAIQKYLDIRKNIKAKSSKDNNVLFLNNKKGRICTRGIEYTIEKAYKKAGINNNIYTVHTLRHTCATLMYRNGTDINIIKELLGHEQVNTTEIYTHLYDQHVKDEMLKHPLAQYKIADALTFNIK